MANPVNDDSIVLWSDDAPTTDTNLPQGSSLMQPGGPTELAGELRSIKSVCRQESINKAWERWAGLYGTLAFVDATHFTLTGDQRTIFQGSTNPADPGPVEIGRRVRCTVTAGTVYGTISNATFGAGLTNVTVVMDSGMLDAGLSEVAFGSDTLGNSSLPGGTTTPLYAVATGTDTYAAAISISAYATGQEYRIRFTNANTGPATLNINSLGPKSIVKNGASPLAAGDLPAGAVAELVYDGTNLQLIGTTGGGIIPMGTSGSGATPIGVASLQVGAVGTPASTVETTLFTYTLPANALVTNGQSVRITAWAGTTSGVTRNRTYRTYFGSTVLDTTVENNPTTIIGFGGVVIRTGAATQSARYGRNGSAIEITSPTQTLTNPVVIKLTGQNSAGVANDIIGYGLMIEYLS